MDLTDLYVRAAAELRRAGALVVTAGAGMGVDSGLPDFRGDQGFWKAYPPYERLGLSFVDAANPAHFERDPHSAGASTATAEPLPLDRAARGLRASCSAGPSALGLAAFVVTSNVDGQFQRAGFPGDRVARGPRLHPPPPVLDPLLARDLGRTTRSRGRARDDALPPGPALPELPARCRDRTSSCSATPPGSTSGPPASAAGSTRSSRTSAAAGCSSSSSGPAPAIPTIRWTSEQLGRGDACVVRINPREPDISAPHLSIQAGALAALAGIDAAL